MWVVKAASTMNLIFEENTDLKGCVGSASITGFFDPFDNFLIFHEYEFPESSLLDYYVTLFMGSHRRLLINTK